MSTHRTLVRMAVVSAVLACVAGQGFAQLKTAAQTRSHDSEAVVTKMMRKLTPVDRAGAAARAAARARSQSTAPFGHGAAMGTMAARAGAPAVSTPGGTPDYFNVPNWTNSPIIRKFVDSLPGLGPSGANNLGQYIPVATPDTVTYPGSDYYEIGLRDYTERMHSDLPPTHLRGYVQLNKGTDSGGHNTVSPAPQHYLGPIIIARRNRPVRVKFTNLLPTGPADPITGKRPGDLFIPVDTSVMGAGTGPMAMASGNMETYTQNRATLHLHGGLTPWISDGTPHQWITPAGETTSYPKGVSVSNVPDMPDPGDGSETFFYTNQQSARLMFYHDHAYGMTRLNVYAGEAAGYILTDPTEQSLITAGLIPATQIPLIIQDKTFVPDAGKLAATDPTWDSSKWGSYGDLWFPHVYMPNQNPADPEGVNAFGRWDYGPWFWPTVTVAAGLKNGPVTLPDGTERPGTPDVSMVMEAFMDTPLVNGTAYPYLQVQRKAYRFRILNACNDRFLNLQLYYAKSNTPDSVNSATGAPTLQTNSGEVPIVPSVPGIWPAGFPVPDGRDGGWPDPAAAGPSMIQIGTEGGFLPAPVVLPNIPIGYDMDRRSITVLNVKQHTLFLGPAERADVIVDFSQVPAGSKLILYSDSPAPVPAGDVRVDYYTGDPDYTAIGGAPTTQAGYGPNMRTIMQFQVQAGTPDADYMVNKLPALKTVLPVAFNAALDPIIVPQAAYGGTINKYARIQDTLFKFTPAGSATPITVAMQPKTIQELFELDYGRMNSTLGVELPLTNFLTQTTIPLGYIDPATETVDTSAVASTPKASDGTQIWKITHNGVDTHAIHFHLFNVQLINRVDWAGVVKPPDANELGWKETVRMNPLEDAIVALRPVAPALPFGIPDSVRPLDPTMPLGSMMGFTNVDPLTGNPITVSNVMANFGWEYVWHCHLLGHEEMDMMRPIVANVPRALPAAPVLSYARVNAPVSLTWTDATPAATSWGNPANEIGFRIERATIAPNGVPGAYAQIGSALANVTSYTDGSAGINPAYSYRVTAYNVAGSATSAPVTVPSQNPIPAVPGSLVATAQVGPQIILIWTDNATNETGFTIQRATNTGFTNGLRTFTVGANVQGFTDTTVSANTTYYYRAYANNGTYNSLYSNTAMVITLGLPPVAPSSLMATTITTNYIILSWNDNSNNEQGFYVERSTNGGGTWIRIAQTAANSSTYRNNGLTTKTSYMYRVQAFNANGASAYSNTLSVATK